jgi:hypothetical protein
MIYPSLAGEVVNVEQDSVMGINKNPFKIPNKVSNKI